MKYLMLFCETEQWEKDWEAMDEAEREAATGRVMAWLAEHSDRITHNAKLAEPDTATSIRLGEGEPVITDGPFVEGKEVVSGYVEVDVPDLDEALRMALGWPGCPLVEIRPIAF
ncbi:hypothetical protein FHX82_004007 [Amycolatopsis bartoniae]|uniref:Transcription initiation protein n=1 Tax=Amycolatopsis bartoniae TaxID=941986 RepID=A0A8H9IRZ1_9PSEU|nr:YciI family protein [Amycolatopsis bartoniae]MBB2936943.1 hypothetical protein [Amycolatopsis bartoniae]TVT01688.1 hypothetical protein FNH07_28775 [Amycolatopsis bartoniae]GHF51375.1 transcription initiation protein [Amycolatopsis bartoniae]